MQPENPDVPQTSSTPTSAGPVPPAPAAGVPAPVPVPAPGAGPAPVPGPQAQAPAQPGLGDVLAPARPSGLRDVLLNLRDVPLTILRGNSLGALELGASVRTRTGRPWLWWLSVHVVFGVLAGIIAATSVNRTVAAQADVVGAFLGDLGGGAYEDAYSIGFGTALLMVVAAVVSILAFGAVRALALGWTLRVRGVQASFWDTADLQATALSFGVVPLAAGTLLSLIPGTLWGAALTIIGAILYLPYSIVSEGLVYIGLNRLAPRAEKSLLVPHALLTTAAAAILVVAAVVINVAIIGSL